VIGACWGGYRPAGPLPDLTPGIRVGAEAVTVESVFEDPELTPWRLSYAPCGVAGEGVVVASGGGTVVYLTPDGALQRRLRTDRGSAGQARTIGIGDLVPVQADDDPECELMDPGGGWRAVGLVDDDGTQLWSFPRSGHGAVDQMAAGHLDADGVLDFVAGMNGFGGIRILDAHGTEIRRLRGGNVFSVALFDTDGDGIDEIIHSVGDGVVGRSADGTLLGYATHAFITFTVVQRPKGSDVPALAGWADDQIQLVDLRGQVLDSVPAPALPNTPDYVFYLPPRRPGGPHLLVVARRITCRGGGRSQVLVGEGGRLLFEENLVAAAISAIPNPDGTASFLLADGARILRYRFQ